MLRLSLLSDWRIHLSWIKTRFGAWQYRPIDQIRERWGRESVKEQWLPTRLFDLTGKSETDSVDDRTWTDLEFDRLFASVDATITPLGSQCLYNKLRIYRDDIRELQNDYAAYQSLRRDTRLREQLQLILWSLRSDSNAHICDSLFGELPATPRWASLVWSMSLVSIAALVATFLNPALGWVLGAMIFCNLIVVARLHRGIHETFLATGCIGRMISVAVRLAKVNAATVSQLVKVHAILNDAEDLRGSFRWLLVDRSNDLVASVFLWLNLLFLADHVAATLAARNLRRHRETLAQIYKQIGSLDADIAIGSWLQRLPSHCLARIVDHKTIELQDAFHPLLSRPVPNSVVLPGHSALVVGTNMAGKTTFIKMVGTNIILGRSLGICFASAAIIPRSKVFASIRAEHSIESGKSRFFAELERILGFISAATSEEHAVFLIDEPFSGTNTPERVASATAVLEYLAVRAQVLATTHDVELQHLLQRSFLTFHFVEDPELQEVFDYRLRPGVCTTKNAIALLEKLGFPSHIIREARRLLDEPSEK